MTQEILYRYLWGRNRTTFPPIYRFSYALRFTSLPRPILIRFSGVATYYWVYHQHLYNRG